MVSLHCSCADLLGSLTEGTELTGCVSLACKAVSEQSTNGCVLVERPGAGSCSALGNGYLSSPSQLAAGVPRNAGRGAARF